MEVKLATGALAMLAATAAMHVAVIRPLEERSARLDRELARSPARLDGLQRVSASQAAFYKYFQRRENADELLAKIYGIATASGLELKTAEYRLAMDGKPLNRYQINLPVTGTYTQIRGFLEAALAEIPVMSLDHASFRRKSANEGRVEAELVLTLHLSRQ